MFRQTRSDNSQKENTMKKIFAFLLLAIMGVLVTSSSSAMASTGTPIDVVFALPGGTNNIAAVEYAAGYNAPANSAIRPLAISWVCAGLAETNAITLRKSTTGAVWKGVAITAATAANGVTLLTDEWYWLHGDYITVKASVTNAMSITIHALEE